MDQVFPGRDGTIPVELRYWEAPETLRRYFGSIYLFTTYVADYQDITRADVPQLRFMLSGGGHYEFHDGRSEPTPEVCMIGPTMGATKFALAGTAEVFGISILPLGWQAMGGPNASEWVDTVSDMVARRGSKYQEQLEVLRATPDKDRAVASLWSFLEARIAPPSQPIIDLVTAIDEWLGNETSPQVDAIVEATGLSARQLARYTNRLYGAPPKLLARKYRALRCASQIVIDKKNWTELCDEGSFYDQSHFIREIKQFIGHTPHQLLNDPTAVARLTVQRRALAGLVKINRIS